MIDMKKGVLYVATGKKYARFATKSAKSLNKTNNLSATIITDGGGDEVIKSDLFEKVIILDDPCNDNREKAANLHKTPYDKTLYLDSDTLILGDVSPVFDLLDRVDIAGAHATSRVSVTINQVPDAFPELSGAVLAYNSNNKTKELFSRWNDLLEEQIKHGRPDAKVPIREGNSLAEASGKGVMKDQVPLREALYNYNISYGTLPSEYNYGDSGLTFAYNKVKILHGSERSAIAPVINKRLGKRVLVNGKLHYVNKTQSIRISGVPYLHPLLLKLRIGIVFKKMGIYEKVFYTYRSISHKLTKLRD